MLPCSQRTGDDTIYVGADDLIFGDAGNDTFVIQATGDGRDSYDGGEGIDTLDYSALNTVVNLILKDGITTYQPTSSRISRM